MWGPYNFTVSLTLHVFFPKREKITHRQNLKRFHDTITTGQQLQFPYLRLQCERKISKEKQYAHTLSMNMDIWPRLFVVFGSRRRRRRRRRTVGTHIPDFNTRVEVERGFVYAVRARVTTMRARHRTTDTTALLKNRGRRAFPIGGGGGDAKIMRTYII